jgi:hypothetical protein
MHATTRNESPEPQARGSRLFLGLRPRLSRDDENGNATPGETTLMADLITEIWQGLKDAGMPEVMLYLPDGSACRCHWDETALVGTIRVALLADQDRKVVRIMPVHDCKGIGIASPKGTDPAGYRSVVQSKLKERGASEPLGSRPVG